MKRVNLEELNNEELWIGYGDIQEELKKRKLVRTGNIVGDRGEFLAIKTYNETSGLPNLQEAPAGTKNIDALSRNGERYSIKTVKEPNRLTGVFRDLGKKDDKNIPEKKFEYVIIVQLYRNYLPARILELTWEQFLKEKHWHEIMGAWDLNITQSLVKESKIILDNGL